MLGLWGALAKLARTYGEIHAHCRFTLQGPAELPDLKPDVAITAYRLIQESLSNVVKHARATAVRADIEWDALASIVVMVVTDNGVGFDPDASIRRGLGLIGMRERVFGISGTLNIRAAKGGGTSIAFTISDTSDSSAVSAGGECTLNNAKCLS
jgi:two-component system sensor histidine kinase UhpB